MILKELDPFHGGDEQAFAARISADRMAYYLRRYYRRSDTVDVLNGLRVRTGGTMARIDHLLLHAHGMMVIEREEISGRVQIDDDGNWTSWVDGPQSAGPPPGFPHPIWGPDEKRLGWGRPLVLGSPITRAYVQALLLKSFLDKRVRQKGFFDNLELDVLVVVADDAQIEWPQTGRLVEVCNRDAVYDRVTQRFDQCRLAARGPGSLTEAERRTLGSFLCLSHWPRSEFEPE